MVFRLYFAKAFLLLLLTCAVYTHVTKACLNVTMNRSTNVKQKAFTARNLLICVFIEFTAPVMEQHYFQMRLKVIWNDNIEKPRSILY